MHCTAKSVLGGLLPTNNGRALTLPAFLLPSLTCSTAASQSTQFSTSSSQWRIGRMERMKRSPMLGVSALRRTGPNAYQKKRLEVKMGNIPKPVPRKTTVEISDDHGLWQFFPKQKSTMATPEELNAHGRSWTVNELRKKDWDDLHRLWWVCIKELNRLQTYTNERNRVGNVFGDHESDIRTKKVRETMKAIKHTLSERWYAWENARQAAMEDEEIDMYADLDKGESAFFPKDEFEVDASTSAIETTSSTTPIVPPPVSATTPTPEARV